MHAVFYMELIIIGKFIGLDNYFNKKYLRFVVKNWLLEMWVEEVRINMTTDCDLIPQVDRFYLARTIPTVYHSQCVYAKMSSIRGPLSFYQRRL